jgi:hypothetical protein
MQLIYWQQILNGKAHATILCAGTHVHLRDVPESQIDSWTALVRLWGNSCDRLPAPEAELVSWLPERGISKGCSFPHGTAFGELPDEALTSLEAMLAGEAEGPADPASDTTPPPLPNHLPELKAKNLADLRAMAEQYGIEAATSMNKAALVQALNDALNAQGATA